MKLTPDCPQYFLNFSSQRDEWMDFGAYVSGKSFESKDLLREKDKKKAAKEEEDKARYFFTFML